MGATENKMEPVEEAAVDVAMETEQPAAAAPAEDEAMNWDDDDEVTETLKQETSAAQKAYDDAMEAERATNAKRAARFGIDVVEPKGSRVFGTKRAAIREGFATGIDFTNEAEAARRRKRAERFGTETLQPRPSAQIAEERKESSEELAKNAARAARFGIEEVPTGEMEVDNLEAKRIVDRVVEESRELALHVFGVDSMSTKDIMQYFGDYGPSWVEWINDSSCNVVFEDVAAVARVLLMAAIPPENDEAKIEMDLLEWREAVPFSRMNGEQVPLHMRQATAADIRPERPNPSSAWARSLQRKHKQRQKQSGGRSGKKRRHREERDMDMEEAYDDDEVLEEAYGRARRRRTDDGPGGEDVPRQMKLNSDDAKRMASMLGKDLRAIISQRKQDEDVEPLEGENYETEGAEGAEADAAMQDGEEVAAEAAAVPDNVAEDAAVDPML